MQPSALRRAFRARPGTAGCLEFAAFLDGLATDELGWRSFVSILEADVIPVVARCHPATEEDEISSICLSGAFERWSSEWIACVHSVARVRLLLREERVEEAFEALTTHPRFCRDRGDQAQALWSSQRPEEAVCLVEGKRSARSYFIARARAQINDAERTQQRQLHLMTRHCVDALGMAPSAGHLCAPTEAARTQCAAELDSRSGERSTWRISALPPAHLLGQELSQRLRRMLGAIDALGPEHARVFKLLLEGLSQRSIAEVECRHPAAISRRVRTLQEVCRVQLLE